MGDRLDRPLGLNGQRPRPGRRHLAVGRLALGLGGVALAAYSAYVAVTPLPLSRVAYVAPPVREETATPTSLAPPEKPNAVRPRSGANLVTTTLPDGSVVTTYAPRPRDGKGPVMIDAPRIGQDKNRAAIPNPDLIENAAAGPLPVVGPDGLKPYEQYGRPWSGARGTRVAIVVGGLGLSQTGTQRAIRQLPEEVTLAFAATGNSLQRWMQDARQNGHEILLQVPFEPFDYPANNPGRGTLLIADDRTHKLAKLHEAMARITNYAGVMNYMGERFVADADALEPVLRDIAARGLIFLDDGSSARSLTGKISGALGLPHASADLQLDDQLQEAAILKRLDELERVARKNGTAIGVASAFDETILAVGKWAKEASGRGIEIVGVSAIATEPGP